MFKQARLKLIGWYMLIIMVISLSFSALIYELISQEINRFASSQRNRIEKQLIFSNGEMLPVRPIANIDQDLIAESQNHLLLNLGIINIVILALAGSLSYFLAGRTLSPIQKMTEDQKRFVSDASHELKTPITALKALFEVSLRDPNLKLIDARQALQDGISQTNQLKTLTDSLLELNHTSNGDSLDFKLNSIKDLMLESVKTIKPQADIKKIKITTHFVSEKLLSDQQKIQELFIILLDNAVKYSPESSSIKFLVKTTKKHFIFKVIDQGIGISPKDLTHVFDRFYRADNARTKNGASGYGLGLSIAQKIVNQHHGKISINSKINQGTEFIISLPIFS